MKIGIIGTRGIPNHYGGFEQFAEYLSVFLAKENHHIYVYNSSNHQYKEKTYKSVHIVHCYDPENKIGTVGQFIYDFNCILHSRKMNFDIILQLGYTSSSIWSFLFPKKAIVITNMDGLEWKRSKYSSLTKKFLKFAEKLAVKHSDFLISDSIGIQSYIKNKYHKDSQFIAYGGHVFETPNNTILKEFSVKEFEYNMLIARLEPENNIHVILEGVTKSSTENIFLIVGNYNASKYGREIYNSYKNNDKIQFLGGIYDINILNNLRYFSKLYFHGHSVGGTNPSLLEAMASNALIVAHDNQYNKYILEEEAYYFKNSLDVQSLVEKIHKNEPQENIKLDKNLQKIKSFYNYDSINQQYQSFFNECIK